MSDTTALAPSSPPRIHRVTFADLGSALIAGFNDFRRAPVFGLFFASFYVIGGILIWLELTIRGEELWVIPIALGFPLLAPFAAVGIYCVSRRMEEGQPLDWAWVLGVVLRQKERQMPSMAMVMIMFFMFWVFIAHLVFALFLGLVPMTNIMTNWQDTLLTQNGLTMLTVGTLVGAGMAYVLFSLTVVALPMLMERELDFITAMVNSFQFVAQNFVVMVSWGILISVLMFLAMLPWFLGLLVVLPILGHATWHLYRKGISFDDA